MSCFYSQIIGNRGPATRGGSKSSGIRGSLQSWDGSVIVDLSYNKDNKLMVEIRTAEGSSSGWGADRAFYGTFEELKEAFKKIRELKESSES